VSIHTQGNVTKLVEDIGALKPAMFIGVPRVFDRIYSGITEQVCVTDASSCFEHVLWDCGLFVT
jgi:long-subunit acyl-CoA synthetase (AMP-forming)